MAVAKKVLVSIEVTKPPDKTTYHYLENFQPNGMVVTARFSDGSTAVAMGYAYPVVEFSTLGQQTINLEYSYEGVIKSTSLTVTVNAIEVAVPTQKEVIRYNRKEQHPVWDQYDPVKMTISGDVTGRSAKTYAVTISLTYGYLFPNGTREDTACWTIDRDIIAALPTQSNILLADGTPKFPIWDGYDPMKMVIAGDRIAADVGDYAANFTPTDNYQWWDGSIEAKIVPWAIGCPSGEEVLGIGGMPEDLEVI